MPTPQERLTAAIKYFFETALPEASGKRLDQLPSPRVHAGAYAAYSGPPVMSSYGQSVTPKFALRVHPALPAAGAVPPQVSGDIPQTGGNERVLISLQRVADHKTDTEDEIQQVIADLDSFAPVFGADAATQGDAPSAPGGSAPAAPAGAASGRSSDWASAIVAARGSLPDTLDALTAVPAGLATLAPDVEALKTVLMQFFTYDRAGKYYPRWAGAGRDGANPAHLTADYKRENVREIVLDRECLYLYAVVPASLLSPGGGMDDRAFREIVIRFDETPQGLRPFSLATIHTARWRRNDAPFCDFVFVYTKEGRGIQQSREARQKMSPMLQSLLAELDLPDADQEAILSSHPFTHKTGDQWFITLTARVEGDVQLPAQALAGDELREWNSVTAPLSVIGALAALPSVTYLGVTTPARLALDLARAEVNFAGLEAKIAADKRGGKGVVVGIIDTGIDGSHPAFGSRILAVWDQDPAPGISGKSPKDNNTSSAYSAMNWGVELTSTSSPSKVGDSRDRKGHGTHVASIAAGQEVKNSAGTVLVPAGLAPNAGIVAVNAIEPLGASPKVDWSLGVDYIFQKAKELGCPCVINMSFGHHNHGHDGSDTDARKIFSQLTDKTTKAYLPGRIVVAAAGNERNDAPRHVRRTVSKLGPGTIKRLATVSVGSEVKAADPVRRQSLTVWIKNPFNACPKNFPVGLMLFRHKTSSTFDVTGKSMLGETGKSDFPTLNTRVWITSESGEYVNGDYSFNVIFVPIDGTVGSSRVDLQACKLEYSIVSPK